MSDLSDPHVLLEDLSTHLALPHNRFSSMIDQLTTRFGEIVSWVWVALLTVIVINVVMRYLFAEGRIEFEEIQWHLYSIGFLVGLSYAYAADAHIRVDVLRESMQPKTQAWIELYGIVILLLPFTAMILVYAVPFIVYAFETGEVSEAPGGLPYRWIIGSDRHHSSFRRHAHRSTLGACRFYTGAKSWCRRMVHALPW